MAGPRSGADDLTSSDDAEFIAGLEEGDLDKVIQYLSAELRAQTCKIDEKFEALDKEIQALERRGSKQEHDLEKLKLDLQKAHSTQVRDLEDCQKQTRLLDLQATNLRDSMLNLQKAQLAHAEKLEDCQRHGTILELGVMCLQHDIGILQKSDEQADCEHMPGTSSK